MRIIPSKLFWKGQRPEQFYYFIQFPIEKNSSKTFISRNKAKFVPPTLFFPQFDEMWLQND
jgi:hypothetical protein